MGVRHIIWFLMLACFALALCGCSPRIEVRGNAPLPSTLEKLVIGQTTMQETAKLLGTPSAIATFDKHIWYYISDKREVYGVFDNTLLEHQVLELTFNDQDKLASKKIYGKDELRSVNYSQTETPTAGREFTFWEQLFGNLGARPQSAPPSGQ